MLNLDGRSPKYPAGHCQRCGCVLGGALVGRCPRCGVSLAAWTEAACEQCGRTGIYQPQDFGRVAICPHCHANVDVPDKAAGTRQPDAGFGDVDTLEGTRLSVLGFVVVAGLICTLVGGLLFVATAGGMMLSGNKPPPHVLLGLLVGCCVVGLALGVWIAWRSCWR